MPDATKTLGELKKEWHTCTKCELGERRQAMEGQFVFGEGYKHGIMFIGEGPGSMEEERGRPFIGPSGSLLRDVLKRLELPDDCYYLTNLVSCRSCSPTLDDAGLPRMRTQWMGGKKVSVPMFKDEPPIPSQMEACKARLYEEIYRVDPLLIVALGAHAASFLLQRKVAIQSDRGPEGAGIARIPGAGFVPVVTDKLKVWARKVKGELQMPIEQSTVDYFVLPTLHPAFVLRKIHDNGGRSPLRQFGGDIQHAIRLFYRFRQEVYGIEPAFTEDLPADFVVNATENAEIETQE